MSIEKLIALEQGNPANSSGSDVANSTNAVIDQLTTGGIYTELPPTGFVWPAGLPEVTATKVGNDFLCNINPQTLIDTTAITQVYRVDIEKGNDANSGSTWATAVKSVWRAIELAMAPAQGLDCKILIKGGIYPVGNGFLNSDANVDLKDRTIVFESVYGRALLGIFSENQWTLEGGQTNTYSCTRDLAVIAVNPSLLKNEEVDNPSNAGYTQYTNVTSIAEVEATEGTFWVNGTTCYVHPHGSVAATDKNVRIYENQKQLSGTNYGNIMFRNIDTEGGRLGAVYSASANKNSGSLVTDGSTHRYCLGGTFTNPVTWSTFSISDLEIKAHFNTDASYNGSDGFGVSGGGSNQNCALLAVNCTSNYNGLLTEHAPSGSKPTSVNGFTGHNGLSAISIGGEYKGSTGTTVAFVHDNTKAWVFGANFGDSEGDTVNGKAIVCGGASIDGLDAKLWLDSCNAAGCDRELQSTNNGELLLRRHTGSGYRQATSGTITNY